MWRRNADGSAAYTDLEDSFGSTPIAMAWSKISFIKEMYSSVVLVKRLFYIQKSPKISTPLSKTKELVKNSQIVSTPLISMC